MQRTLFTLLLLASLAGCSAIIEPDPGRLGGGQDAGFSLLDSGRDAGGTGDDAGPRPDGGQVCPASCDDDVACTADACEDGRCTHTPNDAACADGERCNPVLGCVPSRCTSDAECSDGIFCNGEERCDAAAGGSGCVPGAAPACDDGASCTADRCDALRDECVSEPDHAMCADTVGCTVDTCNPALSDLASGCAHAPSDALCATDFCTTGGTCDATSGCVGGTARDCRDGNPCTSDSCDSAAGACANPPRDDDGDGAPAARVAGTGGSIACGGTDCNDTNASIRPGATEMCDGVDNDCDGTPDEGCTAVPDDCATAQAIPLTGAGTTTVTGMIEQFTSNYEPSPACESRSGARDAVYSLVIPSGTWDVTIDTVGSAIDTVLGVGVGNTCNAATLQHVCNDDLNRPAGTASRVWVHRISSPSFGTPTRLYILVDTYQNTITSGRFQLNVTLANARADNCPTGGSLAFDISGGGSLLGFQGELVGATRGSCQSFADTDGDAVLHVRGPSSGTVDFEVYSIDFVPDIYLRTSPCSSGAELDCDIGAALGGGINGATMRESVTPGNSYFLFVDGGRTTYVVFYQPF